MNLMSQRIFYVKRGGCFPHSREFVAFLEILEDTINAQLIASMEQIRLIDAEKEAVKGIQKRISDLLPENIGGY